MQVFLSCVLFFVVFNAESATVMKEMKDAIGFPEIEENVNLKNKENRQPVYVPSICTEDELYYPGDQKDDWICDCRPAYIYHPKSDRCWPAWRQGPCSAGEYLILPQNSVIPVCQPNPCSTDGQVRYVGACQTLGSISACSHMYPVPAAVGVNATTLEVDCVKLTLESRFGNTPVPKCPPGSKRCVKEGCHTV